MQKTGGYTAVHSMLIVTVIILRHLKALFITVHGSKIQKQTGACAHAHIKKWHFYPL